MEHPADTTFERREGRNLDVGDVVRSMTSVFGRGRAAQVFEGMASRT
jgi:hypothetical protein